MKQKLLILFALVSVMGFAAPKAKVQSIEKQQEVELDSSKKAAKAPLIQKPACPFVMPSCVTIFDPRKVKEDLTIHPILPKDPQEDNKGAKGEAVDHSVTLLKDQEISLTWSSKKGTMKFTVKAAGEELYEVGGEEFHALVMNSTELE